MTPINPPGRIIKTINKREKVVISLKIGPNWYEKCASNNPSNNPPQKAPVNEPNPPIIIATKPLTVHQKPNSGVTWDSVDNTKNAAIPPRTPATINVKEFTRFVLQPISFAVSAEFETALNIMPYLVLYTAKNKIAEIINAINIFKIWSPLKKSPPNSNVEMSKEGNECVLSGRS